MTALDLNIGRPGFFARLRAEYRDFAQRRAIYRRTYDELSMLSDRELADLGMSRYDIPMIARRAADEA